MERKFLMLGVVGLFTLAAVLNSDQKTEMK